MRSPSTRTVRHALAAFLPFVAVASTLCAPAAADDSGPTPATVRVYERLVARFDANHDGRLQVSELPPDLQKRLCPADTDHDGVIMPDELHTLGVARRAARFARADKNGDGKLVPEEVGARWDWLKVADADHDGAVTLDEVERAVASGTLRRMSAEDN